jgi:homoserine O-succinyltransferase
MPDAALAATERQFQGLLGAAAGPRGVRLELFALNGPERGGAARRRLERGYGDLAALRAADLDLLVVTGAQPHGGRVEDEPVFAEAAALADHAREVRLPTVWSCLAAHVAAFRLFGAQRRPLATKLSGVFAFEAAHGHPLTAGAARALVPHSRVNGLCEAELRARGCSILTRSPHHGVDAFAVEDGALFVFLQGHPEYGPEVLGLEWRRDLRLALERGAAPPAPPSSYFTPEAEAALSAAAAEGPAALVAAAATAPLRPAAWRPFAEGLWRSVLETAALSRGADLPA